MSRKGRSRSRRGNSSIDEMIRANVEATVEAIKEPVSAAVEAMREPVNAAVEAVKEPVSAAVEAVKEPVTAAVEAAREPVAAAMEAMKEMVAPEVKSVDEAVYVQYGEQEVLTKEVVEKVKAKFQEEGHAASEISKLRVYIKPEDNAAYYVINDDVNGQVEL